MICLVIKMVFLDSGKFHGHHLLKKCPCASVDFNDNRIISLIFPNLMPEGRLNEQKILIFTILYLNVKNSVNDKNPMTVYETQIATVIGIFMLLEQLINKNQ